MPDYVVDGSIFSEETGALRWRLTDAYSDLENACVTNNWRLPSYLVDVMVGKFLSNVVVASKSFELSLNCGLVNGHREARESAAAQMIAKLRQHFFGWSIIGSAIFGLVGGSVVSGSAERSVIGSAVFWSTERSVGGSAVIGLVGGSTIFGSTELSVGGSPKQSVGGSAVFWLVGGSTVGSIGGSTVSGLVGGSTAEAIGGSANSSVGT
ncbi:hypothetical protein CASFOL_011398 [Castilleja foliolosa]|uniref:Uncharacterized protein n=1 Tax=Castilleja foliolosa TaxID=1961234 RepID=A0ABD3DVS4_9LAMI